MVKIVSICGFITGGIMGWIIAREFGLFGLPLTIIVGVYIGGTIVAIKASQE